MHNNIGIIGVGGIGSWLSFFIHNLLEQKQLNDVRIDLIDDDTVEDKNIRYQFFRDHEIFDPKVEALENYFGDTRIRGLCKKITESREFNGYDVLICCVDNNGLRKMLFEWAEKNPRCYWIDLRSEGRTFYIAHQHPDNTYKHMLATLGKDLETSTSCQRKYELEQGIIQQGNKIVAVIASQYLLNYVRGEKNVRAEFTLTI